MASKSGTLTVKIVGDTAPFQRSMKGIGGRLGGFAKMAGKVGITTAAAIGVSAVKAFGDFDSAMTQSLAIMGDVSDGMRKDMSDAARDVGKTTKFSAAEAAESYFFLASAGLDAKQSIGALPQVAAFAQAGMFDMATATDLATDAQSALGLSVKDPAKNLENLTRVTDVFVGANNLANTSVQQIAEAMTNKAGAAMRSVGMDIEEGSAVLAAFADQGVKGAEAGTQFAIVLRDLQTKALDNKDAFAEAGVEVFDANGKFRNMGEIVGDLEGHLDGMSDAQKKAALATLGFSDKSMGALQTLMGTSDAIREYEGELRSAGGITQEVADKQMDTFNAKVGLLKDRAMDFAIEIGSHLVPMLLDLGDWLGKKLPPLAERGRAALAVISDWWDKNGPAIMGFVAGVRDAIVGWLEEVGPAIRSWVENVLQSMSDWWEDHGPTIVGIVEGLADAVEEMVEKAVRAVQFVVDEWDKFKVAVVAAVLVMIPHFVALGVAAFASALKQLAAWVIAKGGAIGALIVHSVVVAAMIVKWALLGTKALFHAAKVALAWLIAMGPIAWVLLAMAGLVALVIIHFDTIKETIGDAWDWVLDKTEEVWEELPDGVQDGMRDVRRLIELGMGEVIGFVDRSWGTVREKTSIAWGAISGFLSSNWQTISSTASWVWSSITSIISGAWDKITLAVQSAWAIITILVTTLGNVVAGAFRGIAGWVATLWGFFMTLADIVVDAVERIVGAIQRLKDATFGATSGGFGGFLSGGLTGVVPGAVGGILDSFASGVRNFHGGLAVVGEQGPELVRLPRGADVFNARETRNMASLPAAGGGGPIEVVVRLVGPQEMTRLVRDVQVTGARRGVA